MATIGSSATIDPTTPALAMATMPTSAALSPPSPRRMARTKMRLVSIAWAPPMMRLHDAPSARWDTQTTIASTAQISQVPRCGRVVPRTMSRM